VRPNLWCILGQGVLHRAIGGNKVMRSQLYHLAEVAEHPKTTIQVIRPGGAHAGLLGGFVHLERDLWDLRDAAAPAPAPRPFPRPTQLRQTFPRRRRLPQSAGLAQSAYRRYSAMGVLGSAIGLITPIAPTLSAAASAISASSRVRAGR
jgi:Domain of unknown function (DUF5753)